MASSSTVFPMAQTGLFTPPSGSSHIKYTEVVKVDQHRLFDVTGTYGAATDTAKRFVPGVSTPGFHCQGEVMGSSGAVYAVAQNANPSIGTITIQIRQFVLRKVWPLEPVNAGDEPEYTWGIPTIMLSIEGTATGASGPVTGTQSISSLTLVIDQFGQLALSSGGKYMLDRMGTHCRFSFGGRVPVDLSGRYSVAPAYSASTNFSWLFPTPDDPVKGEAILDTGGEVIAHSVLVSDVTLRNPATVGGPVRVSVSMPFDKE